MIVDQLIFNKAASKHDFDRDRKSEKPIRSVAKAFSWRLVGTIDTLVVSYIITQQISFAASIASIDFISKIILYFFHERIWNFIKWGK